jgi:hypothetical protein
MRELYEDRIRRYTAGLEAGGTTEEYEESSTAWRDWRRELLEAEREAIVSLRDEGTISPEVMRRIERDLDLEESSEVHRLVLLPHNGDRAVGVADHRVRYAAYQSPPYPSAPPAAHNDQPSPYALSQVDYLFVCPAHP